MKRQSALIVFSGGQDSTTCLFWALKHYEIVELVTFAYGQRHSLEIEVAKEIAQEQGLKHHFLDMSLLGQITENALTSDIVRQTFLVIQTVVMFLSNHLMSHSTLLWPMTLLFRLLLCG